MNKHIWVIGSSGMLGQSVVQLLQNTDVALLATNSSTDITCKEHLQQIMQHNPITHIINCAAYTQVDACETHAQEAYAVNTTGPAYLGAVAAQYNAYAVHVSTDYVFDGQATTPYLETTPPHPLGVYGISKYSGEKNFLAAMQATHKGFVVRTSWLFGDTGKNFVTTMLRLMQTRATIQVVDDQIGRPTYCDDLARALLKLCGALPNTSASASGIYHYANAGSASWYGFACAILSQAQQLGMPLTCKHIDPIASKDYQTAATRPAYSVLSTDKIHAALFEAPKPWQEALKVCVQRLVQTSHTLNEQRLSCVGL